MNTLRARLAAIAQWRPTKRVGWKDVRSAMRYIDAADPFAQHRIESALATTSAPARPKLPVVALPEKSPSPTTRAKTPKTGTRLNLHLFIERNSKFVRGMSKARGSGARACASATP